MVEMRALIDAVTIGRELPALPLELRRHIWDMALRSFEVCTCGNFVLSLLVQPCVLIRLDCTLHSCPRCQDTRECAQ